MRNLLTLLVCVFLFYSCKEVSYPVPQPSGMKAAKKIPKDVWGKYLQIDSGELQTEDTLVIESHGYRFLTNKSKEDADWLDQAVLGDSLVLKQYKGYYFFNFRVENQWVLRLVKRSKEGNIQILSIHLEGDEDKVIDNLSARLPVTKMEVKGDTFYQIDPSPSQLIELINAGFFTADDFRKIK